MRLFWKRFKMRLSARENQKKGKVPNVLEGIEPSLVGRPAIILFRILRLLLPSLDTMGKFVIPESVK